MSDQEILMDLAAGQARIEATQKAQGKKLDGLCKAVVGNSNPKGGLLSRVAALETRWLIFGVIGAVVTLLATVGAIGAILKW